MCQSLFELLGAEWTHHAATYSLTPSMPPMPQSVRMPSVIIL